MTLIKLIVGAIIIIIATVFSLSLRVASAEAPEPVIEVPQEISNDPVKTYAYKRVVAQFGANNWVYFNNVIVRESRWKCTAKNPSSTAYGLGQLLDSTRASLGFTKSSDCYDQVEEAIVYIKDRYKTPQRAWSFWQANSWY